MPLNPAILKQGLLDIVDNPPKSAAAAAEKLAGVYADYARGAIAGGIPATFTGSEKLRLRKVLEAAFIGGRGTSVTGAQGWAGGLTAFWLTPPVVFGAGVVTVAPFSASIPATLGSIAVPAKDKNPPISQVAQGLDIATRTVLVLIPPSPTPAPVS